MDNTQGVLLYKTAGYLGLEGIVLIEMFSISIQNKLRSNTSSFNRYLRKYSSLD